MLSDTCTCVSLCFCSSPIVSNHSSNDWWRSCSWFNDQLAPKASNTWMLDWSWLFSCCDSHDLFWSPRRLKDRHSDFALVQNCQARPWNWGWWCLESHRLQTLRDSERFSDCNPTWEPRFLHKILQSSSLFHLRITARCYQVSRNGIEMLPTIVRWRQIAARLARAPFQHPAMTRHLVELLSRCSMGLMGLRERTARSPLDRSSHKRSPCTNSLTIGAIPYHKVPIFIIQSLWIKSMQLTKVMQVWCGVMTFFWQRCTSIRQASHQLRWQGPCLSSNNTLARGRSRWTLPGPFTIIYIHGLYIYISLYIYIIIYI